MTYIFLLSIHAPYWIAGSHGDASMGSSWLAWSEADFLPFFFFQYSDAVRDGNRTTNNPENNAGDHSKFDAVLGCECPRLKCSRGHGDRGTQYIKRLLLAQDGHHGTSPSLVTELYISLNFPQRRFFIFVRDSDSEYLNNWYNVQSRIRLKFDTLVKKMYLKTSSAKGCHFMSAPLVLHSDVFYWYNIHRMDGLSIHIHDVYREDIAENVKTTNSFFLLDLCHFNDIHL